MSEWKTEPDSVGWYAVYNPEHDALFYEYVYAQVDCDCERCEGQKFGVSGFTSMGEQIVSINHFNSYYDRDNNKHINIGYLWKKADIEKPKL